jgi:5-methylcytosine-specific restriction endonuclease McrA
MDSIPLPTSAYPTPNEKRCSTCGCVKPLGAFSPRGDYSHRLRSACKDCRAREKEGYRQRNLDKVRASDARYREENREAVNQRYRDWCDAHSDRSAEIAKQSRTKHADARRAYNQQWWRDNAALGNTYWTARRARKLANGGSHTVAEWEELKGACGRRCLCCGRRVKLTKDHVIPLTAGGTDAIDNIQPLCQPCNSSKGARCVDYRPAPPLHL